MTTRCLNCGKVAKSRNLCVSRSLCRCRWDEILAALRLRERRVRRTRRRKAGVR